jgi:hypothetical protein
VSSEPKEFGFILKESSGQNSGELFDFFVVTTFKYMLSKLGAATMLQTTVGLTTTDQNILVCLLT